MIRSIAILGAGVVGTALCQSISAQSPETYLQLVDPSTRPTGAPIPLQRHLTNPGGFPPDLYFICVNTPTRDDGRCDITHVRQASTDIGFHMQKNRCPAIVAIRSTVLPGTADEIEHNIAQFTDLPFKVVSNPEFLRQKHALLDTLAPSRVLIGGKDGAEDIAARQLANFWLTRLGIPPERIRLTDRRTAEATKYAANAMLAGRAELISELACWARGIDANVEMLLQAVGDDPRIGPIHDGGGYGGHCLPKDVEALLTAYPDRLPLLAEIQNRNQIPF